jgi:transcriptional regulator with XRE-family HTH domain
MVNIPLETVVSGRKLREIRIKYGYSLRKFGKICNCSKDYISSLETRKEVPHKIVQAFVTELKLDVKDLEE